MGVSQKNDKGASGQSLSELPVEDLQTACFRRESQVV